MQKRYSVAYKAELVARMMKPGGPTAKALSAETGIPNGTLSSWLRNAHRLPLMAKEGKESAKEWSVADKARIVARASELSGEELGAYLRTEGVHPDQLAAWQKALEDGYDQDKATKRYIAKLEREIRRKDKALAEAAALALLKKKLSTLLEGEDDDTNDSSGS
jgi:transposase-like protein